MKSMRDQPVTERGNIKHKTKQKLFPESNNGSLRGEIYLTTWVEGMEIINIALIFFPNGPIFIYIFLFYEDNVDHGSTDRS